MFVNVQENLIQPISDHCEEMKLRLEAWSQHHHRGTEAPFQQLHKLHHLQDESNQCLGRRVVSNARNRTGKSHRDELTSNVRIERVKPLHHISTHFGYFIRRNGPVSGWPWLFPFERVNGIMIGINTNHKRGMQTNSCQRHS